MQLGYAVEVGCIPHSQDRHTEGLSTPRLFMAGQVDELIPCKPQFGPKVREIFIDQPQWEFVASRWNGRVCSECSRFSDVPSRVFKWATSNHLLSDPFQGHES